MKLIDLKKTYEEMGHSNKLLLFSVMFLAMANLVLASIAFTRHDRIVLVPSHMDKRLEVAWASANADYYKAFGLQVANMIGNITPQSSKFTIDSLRLLMSSKVFASVKPQLQAYTEDSSFTRGTVFSYFTPVSIVYEDKVDKVFVTGFLNTQAMAISAGPSGSRVESKAVTYEMRFIISDGRPLIVDFDSYAGNKPHTQDWLKSNEVRLKRQAEDEIKAKQAAGDKL